MTNPRPPEEPLPLYARPGMIAFVGATCTCASLILVGMTVKAFVLAAIIIGTIIRTAEP